MLIDKQNQKRIQNDAYIAVDALTSLMYAPDLDSEYIKEKLNVVRNCVKFIENFEKEKKK